MASSFPLHVFRAYDVRGIALGDPSTGSGQVEITPEFARRIGHAFVRELGIAKPRLAVGRDDRLTGEKLNAALVEGLVEAGAEVLDIDHATSPYLYFVVCDQKLDGGVSLTASHNPKEYNGFKLIGRDAIPLTETEIKKIGERVCSAEEFEIQAGGQVEKADFKKEYFAKLKSLASLGRKLKVVLDCGNGTAGYFAPQFFRELGCEVVELFCEPDGNFPNHMPNPEDTDSLKDLQKKVVETSADLGLAFDGDGDRLGVVNEVGEIIPADRFLILLVRDLLSRQQGAEVIFDVKCTHVLAAEIEKLGGVAQRWKTGHSFIKRKMKEDGALLAGEVSGHVFFAENYFGVDDGLLAAAKITSIVSNSSQKISELLADVPKTHATPELKLPIDDSQKFTTIKKIIKEFSTEFEDTDALDGVRVNFPDGSWGIVRASNTSPVLTARFEANSAERLAEVKNIFRERLAKYPVLDLSPLDS
ncbi:MAG: phosphomannomutase/phosphoglucomutase [Candidatus Peribacteraceae bacterium]|nr:phosphomannomutase/phosphoglucomutase [Candidatus Peribacteraceae bacterium]